MPRRDSNALLGLTHITHGEVLPKTTWISNLAILAPAQKLGDWEEMALSASLPQKNRAGDVVFVLSTKTDFALRRNVGPNTRNVLETPRPVDVPNAMGPILWPQTGDFYTRAGLNLFRRKIWIKRKASEHRPLGKRAESTRSITSHQNPAPLRRQKEGIEAALALTRKRQRKRRT